MTTTNTVTSTATSTLTAKGPHVTTQPSPEGGHINLAFTQGHPQEKEGHSGKSTSLWNPTYGSWFLQQRKQQQQQRQGGVGGAGGSSGRVPGEGQEHVGRTVAEVAGALGLQHQHQHKQFQHQLQQQHQLQMLHHQQQQQQQGLCRPLLPPPPPPAAQSPLLLDSAALPPVPLYRLRRFPCGNIGYGYQEQGIPLEAAHGNPNPPSQPPPPQQGTSIPSSAAHQRGVSIPTSVSLGRSGMSEDTAVRCWSPWGQCRTPGCPGWRVTTPLCFSPNACTAGLFFRPCLWRLCVHKAAHKAENTVSGQRPFLHRPYRSTILFSSSSSERAHLAETELDESIRLFP
ncbi:hypothetical protein L3Q82_008307 [Scortum barcoo]|uniref:Uncharacterized protein n=1 Tax=Scortum barcoo TaxID=214431 RepID=A0ACB8WI55_9TELE|nr:hypothetical protein L3Q82_008307 [Scortum barcoo]